MSLVKKFCYLVLPAIVFLTGCITTAPVTKPVGYLYKDSQTPDFLLEYYPYGFCFDRTISAPIPDYDSWPDERMNKDLRRISDLGVSALLLHFNLKDVENEHILKRYDRFVSYASVKNIPITFYLDSDSSNTIKINNKLRKFERWLTSKIYGNTKFYRYNNRPLIFLGKNMSEIRSLHPALFYKYLPKEYLDPYNYYPKTDKNVFITAGKIDRETLSLKKPFWTKTRKKGKYLRWSIWKAFEEQAEIICISSWNNFNDGSFIEPSQMDDDQAMVLKQEIKALRDFYALP